ncbi:MAG: 4-alpha-glucanotransferase [Candidatus Gastranaerophilales bacterium]|nr:4-alpha-glucanotransferase [Candidatus Gastranaerophilales bacterium]
MRINNVVRFTSGNGVVENRMTGRNLAFGRELKKNEVPQISHDIQNGYDILGKQVRALIIHGPNFPMNKQGVNQGMGSPYGQKEFDNFASTFGFNYLQLGPIGARNHGQRSHYLSSIYEKDTNLINLELLASDDYANILPAKKLKQIVSGKTKQIPDKKMTIGWNYTRSNFDRAQEITDDALLEAYNNYVERYNNQDETIYPLDDEFEAFKNNPDNSWLDDYAVLHIIAQDKYKGNDWYLSWSQDDQNLISLVQKGDRKATKRYEDIKEDNEGRVELYKFSQFIASKQAQEDKDTATIHKISDRIVSQSSFDILTNRDIFLDDWCIGAKGGGYKGTPQFWGTPLIDPNSLFNEDGTLGKGGEYIKKKFQSALDGVDMIRVDHVFAYANPYVYKRSFSDNPDNWLHETVNGKQISYVNTENLKGNAGFMLDKELEWDKKGEYVSNLDIPGKENYRRIIPEIIFPALREMGFDESDIDKIAWETLGDWNPVFSLEIRPELQLNGMHSMRYMRGDHKECHPHDYALIGTHDDPPAQYIVKHPELGSNGVWDKEYLAPFLRHSNTAPKDEEGNVIAEELTPQELVKAKYVDLFTSKTDKFALNFTDFFGINEQPNVPGTNDEERPENWTLRLGENYDKDYYQALIQYQKEYAVNVPEILRMSIENKLDAGEIPVGQIHKAREAVNKLSRWEEILKEPEK